MNGNSNNYKTMKLAPSSNSSLSSSLPSVTKRHHDRQKHSHDKNEDNINDNIRDGYTRSKCGFGKITWKLAEISALSGFGVSAAIDWLVAQLVQHHREINDGGDSNNNTRV